MGKGRAWGQISEMIRLPLGRGTSLSGDEVPGLQHVGGSVPNTLGSVGSERHLVLHCGNKKQVVLESQGRTDREPGSDEAMLVSGSLCLHRPPLTSPPCPLPTAPSARQPARVLACHRLPGALLDLRAHRHGYGRGRGSHMAAVSLLLLLHQARSDTGQVLSTGTSRAFLFTWLLE